MAQLMPLPLTVSCFSKIQIGFTFLVPAHPGSPGQAAVKRVCAHACVCQLGRDPRDVEAEDKGSSVCVMCACVVQKKNIFISLS